VGTHEEPEALCPAGQVTLFPNTKIVARRVSSPMDFWFIDIN